MRTRHVEPDPEVVALLADAGLPTADLGGRRSLTLLGAYEDGRLVATVGVEAYRDVGLLRSLAVDAARRNAGLGAALVADAEAWATAQGVKVMYLLTTTAAAFFARRGYVAVPRAEAPPAIATTPQFAGLCPATSTFMRKALPASN